MSDPIELESGNVFRLRSIHDIFAKLYREKRRFEEAGADNEGRKDQVDAAVNFAITAWHMTDWAWQRRKHELGKCYGVSSLKNFQNELRKRCRDLAVCDVIANAAKHGGTAHNLENRPEIETILISEAAESAPSVELYVATSEPRWLLRIKVNDNPEDLQAIFYRVLGLWHRIIQKHFLSNVPS